MREERKQCCAADQSERPSHHSVGAFEGSECTQKSLAQARGRAGNRRARKFLQRVCSRPADQTSKFEVQTIPLAAVLSGHQRQEDETTGLEWP